MFVQMGDGVDEATWEFHRQQRDYSRWAELSIKDRELSAEFAAIEIGDMPFDRARAEVHDAIERRYTLPS